MRGTRPGKARRTLNIRVSRIESCAAHDQKSAPRRHLKARRATRHASVPAWYRQTARRAIIPKRAAQRETPLSQRDVDKQSAAPASQSTPRLCRATNRPRSLKFACSCDH